HHWPFIELTRNVRSSGKDIPYGPASFIAQQILLMTPLTFPIWLAGLLWLFFSERGRAYRALGWAFAVTFGVFLLAKSKSYYVAPAYPVVFAAGGLALDEAIDRIRQGWLKPVFVVLLLAATALLLPTLIPVLSVDAYLRYQDKLPFALPATERSHLSARLPHHFAWQFGWEEMTAGAARAYYSLPLEERLGAAQLHRGSGDRAGRPARQFEALLRGCAGCRRSEQSVRPPGCEPPGADLPPAEFQPSADLAQAKELALIHQAKA
ncbi:MAG: hypothetical protein NTZ98_25220, partial [Acidobacteria bacterium]|nr:hypothetical protein [Acidobacteriota bacterium]